MHKTKFLFSLLGTALIAVSCAQNGHSEKEFDYLLEELPFKMERVARPEIPSNRVDLTEFGGNGNGIKLNTEAFASAIAKLESMGGGCLNVPAGIWKTGPITLKSNIELHLEHNAVVLFDSNPELYPVINTVFEGLDTRRCEAPINAEGAHDIAITGSGVFDGNGQDWRALKKSKVSDGDWKKKLALGGVLNEKGDYWYPDEGYRTAMETADMNVPDPSLDENFIKRFLRPELVSLRGCTNVLIEGCTFQNSPCWNIHPLLCKKVIVKGITVRNPAFAQNGDGIDIDSCEDFILVDSSFDVGDDGICIKSGKDEDGRRRATPTKRLVVDGCTVYHGHGGFVVGSEMSGGVEDVSVSNCRFLGTDVGLRFKSKRGRGGVVSGIHIRDIYMTDIVTETLLFDLFYGGKSAVEMLEEGTKGTENAPAIPAVDETTPSFRDIHISNVVCNGAGRAMYFNGLPEMPVEGIHIEDCTITAKTGIEIRRSKDVSLKNVQVFPEKGEPFTTFEAENISVE